MSKDRRKDMEELAEEFEISPEEFEEMMESVEQFQEDFLRHLAGTDRYDVLPTTTESGVPLTKEQYKLAKTECSRLGIRLLYVVDMGKDTLIINPHNMKIGIINEEVH